MRPGLVVVLGHPTNIRCGRTVLPLFAQGQHYVFYLFFTTGGGGSFSLITTYVWHRGRRDGELGLVGYS